MKIAVFFPGIGYHCDKPLLRVDEFLALCKHLELDPIIFCPTDTKRGD